MNIIYPILKLGKVFIVINKNDMKFLGGNKSVNIKCIKIDFEEGRIEPVIALEKHLKFNPWVEIQDDERKEIQKKLRLTFSEQDILEKIEKPLVKSRVE